MQKEKVKIMVGVDEVGRGALAGPVVAAATVVAGTKLRTQPRLAELGRVKNKKLKIILNNLKDSKKLTAKKREKIFEVLKKSPEVEWGIGRVSEKVIDKINIFQATKLAMKRAVNNLKSKIQNPNFKIKLLLIDGNFRIDLPVPQKSVVKGDEKVFLIKLASIVAKVTRDRMMLRYHKKYPRYRFDKHKGYGTKLHLEMLKKYGPCKIHRKTFKPIALIQNSKIKNQNENEKSKKKLAKL
jgi:ribonuclease HII